MPFYVNSIGVCTGWGATGTWVVDDQGDSSYGQQGWSQPPLDARGGFGGSPCWVPSSNGAVPPDAVEGGRDGGETIFVARARHEGDLIPAKLKPSHGVAYVCIYTINNYHFNSNVSAVFFQQLFVCGFFSIFKGRICWR